MRARWETDPAAMERMGKLVALMEDVIEALPVDLGVSGDEVLTAVTLVLAGHAVRAGVGLEEFKMTLGANYEARSKSMRRVPS